MMCTEGLDISNTRVELKRERGNGVRRQVRDVWETAMDSLQNFDLFAFLTFKDRTISSKVMINCQNKKVRLYNFCFKSHPIVQSFDFKKVNGSEFCRESNAVFQIPLTCLQTPFGHWRFNSAVCK